MANNSKCHLLAIMVSVFIASSVTTSQTLPKRTRPASPVKNQESLSDLVRRIKPAVASIVTFDVKGEKLGLGSGFFIEPTIVVTNQHVIERASRAQIRTPDGGNYSVLGLVAVGDHTDLVLLRVDVSNSRIIPLKISNELPIEGEAVFVIGNPRGLEWSLSNGIVSAIRSEDTGKLIQITAPISPGSSGSPVINSDGHVIGVATLALLNGQNLNFAIPANQLALLRRGEIKSLATYYEDTKKSRREESEQWRSKGANLWSKNIGIEGSKAALPHYEKAVAVDAENGKAWHYLGTALEDLGRYADAIDSFKKSIDLAEKAFTVSKEIADLSDLFMSHYTLGEVYLKTKNPSGASNQHRTLKRLLELIPSAVPSPDRYGESKEVTYQVLSNFADSLQREIEKYFRDLQ